MKQNSDKPTGIQWLRFKMLQFRFQNNDFWIDMSRYLNDHDKQTKKIFKFVIIASIIVFLLVLIGSALLSSVTITYNGQPIHTP